MRIAVVTRDASSLGGSNQYAQTVLEVIRTRLQEAEYKVFCEYRSHDTPSVDESIIHLKRTRNELLMSAGRVLSTFVRARFPYGKYKAVHEYRPDLIVCTNPSRVGSFLKIPYITPVHDLMHRTYRDLPEISLGEKLRREFSYRTIAKTSLMCVVNCEAVKSQMQEFYGTPAESIEVIHEIPPPYVFKHKDMKAGVADQILSKYSLPREFVFYPAQLWPHKNHLRLLKALSLLYERYNITIPMVFVGSKKEESTYRQLSAYLRQSPINRTVTFLGYVGDMEMVALYKKARVLVFPSINISTGIPIAEALFLGTPVLCSDLGSYREQVDEAGLLFDPFSVEDMAEKIRSFWLDPEMGRSLVDKAIKRRSMFSFATFADGWYEVIDRALRKI